MLTICFRSREMLKGFIGGSATPRTIAAFQDILSTRAETSDLMWVSREWKPRPVSQFATHRTPAKIRRDVMSSPRIQHVIEEVRTTMQHYGNNKITCM